MNIQELETVKRENLPIKIFILNNRVLGKISETQHFNHGDLWYLSAVFYVLVIVLLVDKLNCRKDLYYLTPILIRLVL